MFTTGFVFGLGFLTAVATGRILLEVVELLWAAMEWVMEKRTERRMIAQLASFFPTHENE